MERENEGPPLAAPAARGISTVDMMNTGGGGLVRARPSGLRGLKCAASRHLFQKGRA